MDDTLSPILLALLTGLDAVGRTDDIRSLADAWISDGRHLDTIASWLATQNMPDAARLGAVVARARATDDRHAVLTAANAAARLWDKKPDPRLVDDAFMPCVAHFTAVGQTNWIRHAWDIRQGDLVAALDEAKSRSLLASFVQAPEIDYDGDLILATVADKRPALVIEFLDERVRRDRDHAGERFDAIPFRSHDLPKVLARHPALLLSASRRWYDLYPALHQFRGGRLVANVFPKLAGVAGALAALVALGDRDDMAFVLATLQPYDGIEEVYPICMDVVDRIKEGDDLLRRVSDVLGETSVISGEFGHVELEGEQHGRLGHYLDDPRPKVRAFVQEARRHAEQSMAWEQRRAEQDVEQMRRDWD